MLQILYIYICVCVYYKIILYCKKLKIFCHDRIFNVRHKCITRYCVRFWLPVSMFLSWERKPSASDMKEISKWLTNIPFPHPSETIPLPLAELQSILGIPDRAGQPLLFRARYALPRFHKGSRRACLECCRPHPRRATRETKNHPSIANIHPWYFVRKFTELRIKLHCSTSNERMLRNVCEEYFTSRILQYNSCGTNVR